MKNHEKYGTLRDTWKIYWEIWPIWYIIPFPHKWGIPKCQNIDLIPRVSTGKNLPGLELGNSIRWSLGPGPQTALEVFVEVLGLRLQLIKVRCGMRLCYPVEMNATRHTWMCLIIGVRWHDQFQSEVSTSKYLQTVLSLACPPSGKLTWLWKITIVNR